MAWAKPSQELRRVEPSRVESLGRAKSGVGPSQEPSQGPGGFVFGLGLEMPGVVVAIGCIVYECLEHEVDIYAAVIVIESILYTLQSLYGNFIQVRL